MTTIACAEAVCCVCHGIVDHESNCWVALSAGRAARQQPARVPALRGHRLHRLPVHALVRRRHGLQRVPRQRQDAVPQLRRRWPGHAPAAGAHRACESSYTSAAAQASSLWGAEACQTLLAMDHGVCNAIASECRCSTITNTDAQSSLCTHRQTILEGKAAVSASMGERRVGLRAECAVGLCHLR